MYVTNVEKVREYRIIEEGAYKVKVMIPMYEPLEVTKCKKCSKIIAGPKELVRTVKKK